MSFSIPIMFEDTPFFEEDDFFRRKRGSRATRDAQSRREPATAADVLPTWREEPIFEEPRYGGTHFQDRPRYRGRPKHEEMFQPFGGNVWREKMRNYYDEDEEDEQNIGDNDELGGVTGKMRDLGGWDIPVQFVSPGTRERGHGGHRRGHHPKKHVTKHVRSGRPHDRNTEENTPRLVKVVGRPQGGRNIAESADDKVPMSQTTNVPKADVNVQTGVAEESGAKETNMQSENSPSVDNEEMQSSDTENLSSADKEEMESSESNKEHDSGIEIAVEHPFMRPKPKDGRRLSRRLSQCDPPPLTEIKIARIRSILDKTVGLEGKIQEFEAPLQNNDYLYISETLMKALLDLDGVDSDGLDAVRTARKEGVKAVQYLVEKLENKLAENRAKK